MNIKFVITGLLLPLLTFNPCSSFYARKKMQPTQRQKLPKDLLFAGKPISNASMEQLVPILHDSDDKEIDLVKYARLEKEGKIENPDNDDNDTSYEWRYIGTLLNGDHLIYGYYWPEDAMGKFTGIAVIKREGTILKVVGYLAGGDRHASMINSQSCILKSNQLTYDRHMTLHSFYHEMLDQFHELKKRAQSKSYEKLWYGEAGFLGSGTFEVTINSQGEFEKNKLISFTPANDGQVSDEKKYTNFIKNTPLASLSMGDAIGEISNLYLCKNKTTMIPASQFKEMMKDVLRYAKDES